MTTLDQDRKAKAVLNEQVKLAATYLNGLAVAIFIVVGVAPMFASGEKRLAEAVAGPALLTFSVAVVISVAVHLAAQFLLRKIKL